MPTMPMRSAMWCCGFHPFWLVFFMFLMIYLLFVNIFYSCADSCYVNIREAPQSKHKHSWVVFLTALHPSFTHQTTDAGWWVFVFLVKKKILQFKKYSGKIKKIPADFGIMLSIWITLPIHCLHLLYYELPYMSTCAYLKPESLSTAIVTG